MRVIFEVSEDESQPEGEAPGKAGGASERLRRLLHDDEVTQHLDELGAALVDPLPASCSTWLEQTLASTVGAVMREAFQRLCPRLDVDRLVVDIDPRRLPDDATGVIEVWLCEDAPGGAGIVAQIARDAVADPRRLLHLAAAAAGETEHEQVDYALRTLVRRLPVDRGIRDALDRARASLDPTQKAEDFAGLLAAIANAGIVPTHAVATAVAARILRPGSSRATDQLLLELLDASDRLRERVGFEPDPRAAAFALSRQLDIGTALEGLPAVDDESWRFAQIYSLMWPAGWEARSPALSTYNRFASLPPAERLLIESLLAETRIRVNVEDDRWRDSVESALASDGSVALTSGPGRQGVRAALLQLCVEPVDLGFIHAYPRIIDAHLSESGVAIGLEITEIA